MNAVSARPDDSQYLGDADLAAVIDLKRTARTKPAVNDGENNGPKKPQISSIKRTVYKNAQVVLSS